jgi:hypothetical protein
MGRAPRRENCHEENSRQSSSKDACTTSGLGSRGARHTFLDGVLAAVCFRTIGRAADSKRVPPSQRELVTRIIKQRPVRLGFAGSSRALQPCRLRASPRIVFARDDALRAEFFLLDTSIAAAIDPGTIKLMPDLNGRQRSIACSWMKRSDRFIIRQYGLGVS